MKIKLDKKNLQIKGFKSVFLVSECVFIMDMILMYNIHI